MPERSVVQPQQIVSAPDKVLERIAALVGSFERSEQHEALLAEMESSFRRFSRLQGREIVAQHQALALGENPVISEQLRSSVEIFDTTRKDQARAIERFAPAAHREEEHYRAAHRALCTEIAALSRAEREQLLTILTARADALHLTPEQLLVLQANITRTLPPERDRSEVAFEHFRAWQRFSTAAARMELHARADAKSDNTLSDRRQTQALRGFVEAELQSLPEAVQRQYLMLARKAFTEAQRPRETADTDWLSEEGGSGIELQLSRLMPQFDDHSIASDVAPSEETKAAFADFLGKLAEKAFQLEIEELIGSREPILSLRDDLARQQQQVVDTFFEQVSPSERVLWITEAQRRLDAELVDMLRAFNHQRPVEARFADLISGVELPQGKRDPFEDFIADEPEALAEHASQPPEEESAEFERMVAELEKLHRLETIVVDAAASTERDLAAVYRRSAEEIRAILEQDFALDRPVTEAELFRIRLNHIAQFFGEDNSVLDAELERYTAYRSQGMDSLVPIKASEFDVFIESGRLHDAVTAAWKQRSTLFTGPAAVAARLAPITQLPSRGVSALARLVAEADTDVDESLDELNLPDAQTPLRSAFAADTPEVILALRERSVTLEQEISGEHAQELLYQAFREIEQAESTIRRHGELESLRAIRTLVESAPDEETKAAQLRELRALADARLIIAEEEDSPIEQEFSLLVLQEFPDPDYKPFGSNYSRVSDALAEQDQTLSGFNSSAFVLAEVASVPEDVTIAFRESLETYRSMPSTEIHSSARSYGEYRLDEIRRDIAGLLAAAAQVYSRGGGNVASMEQHGTE